MNPFTWTVRGHCRVVNWPNFNIIVSYVIGRPDGSQRGEGTTCQWSSQNTHLLVSSLSCTDTVCATPNNYNSNTKNHWSQITRTNIIIMIKIIMIIIKFEILPELPKWGIDTKWAKTVGKMVLIELPEAGLPQAFNL